MRSPITSSTRPRVVTQAVRGPIDWGATIRMQCTGAAAGLYVVRPARRIFDTPENRALSWALKRLEEELSVVVPDTEGAQSGWSGRLQENLRAIRTARRRPWLREIPGERPSPATLKRLAAARTSFYKLLLPEALRAIRRWSEQPSPTDLTELLCARYFEPSRTWQLFELVVALRLARAFAEVGVGKRRGRLLTGTGRAPFAAYPLNDGTEIRLWYQAWPDAAGSSVHAAARLRHHIKSGETRPDIVIERRHVAPALLLLELKATRSPSYLAQGLSQLLGYIKERHVLSEPACAWLVAPSSSALSRPLHTQPSPSGSSIPIPWLRQQCRASSPDEGGLPLPGSNRSEHQVPSRGRRRRAGTGRGRSLADSGRVLTASGVSSLFGDEVVVSYCGRGATEVRSSGWTRSHRRKHLISLPPSRSSTTGSKC